MPGTMPYEPARILSLVNSNLPLILLSCSWLQPCCNNWKEKGYNIFEQNIGFAHTIGLRLTINQTADVFRIIRLVTLSDIFNKVKQPTIFEIEERIKISGLQYGFSIIHGDFVTQIIRLNDSTCKSIKSINIENTLLELNKLGLYCDYQLRRAHSYIPLPLHIWGNK